jgi:hypothetical protein
MSKSSYSDCPICFETFPSSVIENHASACTGQPKKSSNSSTQVSKESVKVTSAVSPSNSAKKRPLTSASSGIRSSALFAF